MHSCIGSNSRPATPEETTFHLLHLSLFREYLDFEFAALKVSPFLHITTSFSVTIQDVICA